MDEKKNAENGEYQFIREKIISKKKSRVKRVVLIAVGTIVLAVVFGFVSRLSFMASEEVVGRILGFSPTPSFTPTPTRAPILPPTDRPTSTPVPTPTPTPVDQPSTPTEMPSATPTEAPTPTPSGIPGDDPLDAFMELYTRIGKIAKKAIKSLVQVDYVAIDTDWFGEPLESSTSACGIVIGDNGVEYLVLAPASSALAADRIDVTVGKTVVSEVQILASDAEYDIALLSIPLDAVTDIDRKTVEYAKFGASSQIKAGDPVIVAGSPNGYIGTYEFTMVTNTGIFAYVTDDRFEIYNTNMPENAIGSGIFVNFSGEIIGIMTHNFKDAKSETVTTMVATDDLIDVIWKLANGTTRNYLGVVSKETPESVLKRLELKSGLYVTDVKAESPAELAGIKKGDILVRIDGTDLKTVDTLNELLNSCEAGAEVKITLIRNTKPETVTVVIGEIN